MPDKQHGRIQTAIPEVPVTVDRSPFNPGPGECKALPNAGTARANKAATTDAPEGTPGWADKHSRQTVLQQHCVFFDPDSDGVIWPLNTFWGFRALGFNLILCAVAMFIIHGSLSYPTGHSWLPDPFFRLYIDNMHKAKHGSDSGTYDNEGRFIPQKFEDWFSKYANGKDALTWSDVWDGLKGQRVVADPFGWIGAFFEWIATYLMLWPEDGMMKKDDIRRVYDGSIFYDIASKRAGQTTNRNPRQQGKAQSSR